EWVHVQLHQQKGMISLSPPTICNSATANKALVGHFMPGTSVTWKPVPSSWVYFVNSYLKGDKMAKSCDYEAIRVFISVNVGKYTNNAITVNYSDSVCATRHYHSTKINSGG
ncbi:hypothetical protein, partial [Escherichia coli]|uniref:hypothetical protein n=1 Tax=Escherichia coli TaxID=562 RepID=UPI00313AFE55